MTSLAVEIVHSSLSTYWMLRLFLFGVLLFCGWGISYKNKDNKYFWYYASFVILFYTLIEGLRFDRGIDYYHYYQEICGTDLGVDREPLYQLILDAGQAAGTPFWVTFLFYSFLLIWGYMFILKRLPDLAVWALPIFYLVTFLQAENLIRQFVAFSFLFFAYGFYLRDKKLWMYAMLAIVPFIHLSGLFGVGMFLLFVWFDPCKWFKQAWIPMGLYVIVIVGWNVSGFSEYTSAIAQMQGFENTNFQGYIDNSERWFSEEGTISNVMGSTGVESPMTLLVRQISNLLIVWFGYLLYKQDKSLRIPYYFAYFSIIIFQVSGGIELIDRLGWWLFPFLPLVVAAIIIRLRINRWIKYGIFGIFFINYILKFLVSIGKPNLWGEAFVWDIITW